jgi:cytochrome c5
MQKIYSLKAISLFILSLLVIVYSCGKGSDGPPPDPCAGVTITVTATATSPGTIGGSDGAVNATASGGSASFTYSINGGAFQSSGVFTGLVAGNYTVTAKNSNGCTGTSSVTVNAPPNPCTGVTVTVTATTVNPTTAGGNNGSINATASGATGFTYSLNSGAFQASGNFAGLTAGTYTITAKSSAGCTGTANFTLTDPCSGVTITVGGTFANPTTNGGSNGSISATASGGTAPYTFSLNSGAFQSSGNFTGLAAGAYTVTAKSATGCTGSGSFTLTNPNPCAGVTINVTNSSVNNTPCVAANGSITAAANGGASPYTYSINSGPFQSGTVFSSLAAGSYTITAKDANGCTGNSTVTNINNLAAGPLFTQVKTVLQNNCESCHNNSIANGGMNWSVECNIVTNKARIKARAVDGNPSAMPPTGLLPAGERQKITDWINAGGRYTD